jgi:hypothetical protein
MAEWEAIASDIVRLDAINDSSGILEIGCGAERTAPKARGLSINQAHAMSYGFGYFSTTARIGETAGPGR